MSTTSPPNFSRPGIVDYFLILGGCGLSLLLAEWSEIRVIARANFPPVVLRIFPQLLLLAQGIVLLWPLFYSWQRWYGRDQGLAAGEWLWGAAWLAGLALAGWIAWRHIDTLPAFLDRKTLVSAVGGYSLGMALIALAILVRDLFRHQPRPWTHSFCLVLMIWPALPLAVLWLWNLQIQG